MCEFAGGDDYMEMCIFSCWQGEHG